MVPRSKLNPIQGTGNLTTDMSPSILPAIPPDSIQTIVPRRYWKTALYSLCLFGVFTTLAFFYGVGWDDAQIAGNWSPFAQRPSHNNNTLTSSPDYPPDYAEWHKIEEALPQHNQSLPFPEGKDGRYVYFSEHVKSASVRVPIPEYLMANHPTLQQRRAGGMYSRSTSCRDCWPTSGGDRT